MKSTVYVKSSADHRVTARLMRNIWLRLQITTVEIKNCVLPRMSCTSFFHYFSTLFVLAQADFFWKLSCHSQLSEKSLNIKATFVRNILKIFHGRPHTLIDVYWIIWQFYCMSKGAGTLDYNPLYTGSTLFYSDYFVGDLWAHLTTIHTRIFLYFAYLQG